MRISEFELAEPLPEMKDTIAVSMLRPWIDVGRVGTLSLRALQRYLGAKEMNLPTETFYFFMCESLIFLVKTSLNR